MDDSEIGALILEAGASENLKKLKEIKRRVADDKKFLEICNEYSDFSTGRNVLHLAAETGNLDICKFLIKSVGVYIESLTYNRDTPLTLAAKEDRVKIVKYLINQGAQVNKLNVEGSSALHYAVLKDNRELTELLLDKGARIDVDSVDGTPLQIAICRGYVKAVEFLLFRGAEPNSGFIVDPPLVCAVKSHSFECFELLLKAKADPNHYFTGFSPLSYAAKEGDTKFLKALLDAGAYSLNTGPAKPIEDAALAHNREGVKILFPRTKPIEHYPIWSVDGIMEYCNSEEAKEKRDEDWRRCLARLDKSGHASMSSKEYNDATIDFRMAQKLDPSNAIWASKRSLCCAHAGLPMLALYNARECFSLEPRAPGPHHGDAAATAQIFEKLCTTGLAFMREPHNKEFDNAFRLALFDYFACLYLMSSPDEIVSLSKEAKEAKEEEESESK